jgi:hypothetical protein
MLQALEHGAPAGPGGGAQPVEQPLSAGEGGVRAVPEGQAAERADGAVVRGGGEADSDAAEKVLEQDGATGPGGGAALLGQPASAGDGTDGAFREGQGVRRAEGAAVPQGGGSNYDPQNGIGEGGSLGLGLRQRGAASAPKPPSDPRKVGKAIAEYCMHRDVLDKRCTAAVAEHFYRQKRAPRCSRPRGDHRSSARPRRQRCHGAWRAWTSSLPAPVRPACLQGARAAVLGPCRSGQEGQAKAPGSDLCRSSSAPAGCSTENGRWDALLR